MPPQTSRRRSSATTPTAAAVVTIRLCRAGIDCGPIAPSRISDLLPEPDALLWLDIRDPGPPELELLAEEFGFHGLALEDVAKQRQRPKVDEYPGYRFVVMYAPEVDLDGEILTTELDLFIGKNYVVTLHRGESPPLKEAADRWERTDPVLRQNVGFLVHTIMDTVIDSYFPVVDTIEDQLDELELRMFAENHAGSPEQLLGIKRGLFVLRKSVYPLREVFNSFLRLEGTPFGRETAPYFQDVYDHILRLLDTIDIQRDMASSALDAHLATVSNRLNETMKRLTVVAMAVAIMGAVFGAWGMNFDRVPLSHTPWGFWFLTGGTLAAVLLSAIIAWWRRWL